MKLALEKGKSRTLRLRRSLQAMTKRLGSLYGRGRNSTALVTLKIAVLAPTPRAMVSAAVSAKIGFFAGFGLPVPDRVTASFHLIHGLSLRKEYYLCGPQSASSFFGNAFCRDVAMSIRQTRSRGLRRTRSRSRKSRRAQSISLGCIVANRKLNRHQVFLDIQYLFGKIRFRENSIRAAGVCLLPLFFFFESAFASFALLATKNRSPFRYS